MRGWSKKKYNYRQYIAYRIFRKFYSINTQRRFKNICNSTQGYENVVSKLESRLDIVLYRLKFATTVGQAKEIIKSGSIYVQGELVTNYKIYVKPGETIKSTHWFSLKRRLLAKKQKEQNSIHYIYTGLLTGILLESPKNIVPSSARPKNNAYNYIHTCYRA